MEVKLPTEGTRYVQALLLTATAYLQYRAHFLPAVAAYRGYGRPAVPKVPVQALRACLAIGHGTLPLPSVAWLPGAKRRIRTDSNTTQARSAGRLSVESRARLASAAAACSCADELFDDESIPTSCKTTQTECAQTTGVS